MDVQFDVVDEESIVWPRGYRSDRSAGTDAQTLAAIENALAKSSRPVIFASAGGSPNRLQELSEAMNAPTFVNGRARGSFPYGHSLLGNHTRGQALATADLVLALGVDWDFRTNYGERVNPSATVIHVDAEATKIGWNRPVDLGVVADPMQVVAQLLALSLPSADAGWVAEIVEAEKKRQDQLESEAAEAASGLVPPQRFGKEVGDFFGRDSIVALDGGDIISTTARWLQISTPGHVLDPGPFGTLGTGAPFALAAQVIYPEKLVGLVLGDGAFGFNGFEFDTFVRLRLPIVAVMGNDGVWGNIKTFHTMMYPDRVVAADLGRRPYHEVVSALGGHGELVTEAEDLAPALKRARASGLPALVNVHIAETMRMSSNYSQ
jgi:acetolactate synthase-1/2/3 large subunit